MANGPSNTNSYIYKQGASPATRVAVTQKNKVYGYTAAGNSFQQIGVVSEFGHDESRSIEPVRGVGFGDQIAELVPGVTEPMTMTLNKTLMYAFNLFQSVGYLGGVDGLVRSLKHHRWPFDIKQEIVFSELAGYYDTTGSIAPIPPATQQGSSTPNPDPASVAMQVQALFTFYEGCWFNSYSASFTSDAAIVMENGSVTVTDCLDGVSQYGEFINSGLSIGNGGTAGAGYSLRFAGGANNNQSSAVPGF